MVTMAVSMFGVLEGRLGRLTMVTMAIRLFGVCVGADSNGHYYQQLEHCACEWWRGAAHRGHDGIPCGGENIGAVVALIVMLELLSEVLPGQLRRHTRKHMNEQT